MTFIKKIMHNKTPLDKIKLEIELQSYVSNKYNFCPKIIDYIHYDKYSEIIMEDIGNGCIANEISENPDDIPEYIWKQIRKIITTLFYQEGIEYIDVTPYNFIEKNNKVYIIDFGDAYWSNKEGIITNWYLEDFILNEHNYFNPDYK